MRLRLNPIVSFALLALGVLAFAFGIDHWRHRPLLTNTQLVAMLPAKSDSIFFANIAILRQAGLMKALAGVKPAEDKDYAAFVSQTHFDYTRDLDVLAGGVSGDERFFLARGRFDWPKLRNYVETHGGTCEGERCQTPASTPGRWATFREIDASVAALAVGRDRNALDALHPEKLDEAQMPSSEPIWMRLSPEALKDLSSLPPALRLLAAPLQQADSLLVSLGSADANSGAAFAIRMDALFPSAPAAQAASKQLQLETNMLKLAILRGREQPSSGDFTSVLTGGRFEAKQARVYGTWPVSEELVKSLQ